MKPETATRMLVLLLLSAAVLSLASRPYWVAQAREDDAHARRSARDRDTTHAVENRPPVPDRERPAPPAPRDAAALGKRLLAIHRMLNDAERFRAVLDLTESFTAEDWALALDAMQTAEMQDTPTALLLLSHWSALDPQAALAWSGPKKKTFSVYREWLETAPDAALSHLLDPATERGETWRTCARVALEQLSPGNLPRTVRLLGALTETDRKFIMSQVKLDFSRFPGQEVKASLATLDTATRSEVLMSWMGTIKTVEDRIALMQSYPQDLGPEVLRPIYEQWIAQDSPAALAAFEELPPGSPEQKNALTGLIPGLCKKGQEAQALELVKRCQENVPQGVISDLVVYCGSSNPALALEPIRLLRDESSRITYYRMYLGAWVKKDPATARAWVEANVELLPAEIRPGLK